MLSYGGILFFAHKGERMIRSKITINHRRIIDWVTRRGGQPAAAHSGVVGALHLHFPGEHARGRFRAITWGEFFDKFEKQRLALLYQEGSMHGYQSRFCKLISRDCGDGLERWMH